MRISRRRVSTDQSGRKSLNSALSGCRVSEAFALRWSDVDLEAGLASIEASIDFQGKRGPTKTRKPRSVELSTRLREALSQYRPDVFGADSFAFPSQTGSAMEYQNFRSRVFNRIVRRVFAQGRRVTPHCLRHTFASLHIARGTNLLWIQEAGGWASAKMLLDVYGHFMPTESASFADAITAPNGTPAAPTAWPRRRSSRRRVANERTRTADLWATASPDSVWGARGASRLVWRGVDGADERTRTADLRAADAAWLGLGFAGGFAAQVELG